MTRERWHLLAGEWCVALGIETPPRLKFVASKEIPGCYAVTEYFRAIEDGWLIKIQRGYIDDPEIVLVHELLHVRTGCTDQVHEPWIRSIAALLVRLKRSGDSAVRPV